MAERSVAAFGEPLTDTSPSPFPEHQPLVGKHIALVPLKPEHAPSFWEAIRGEENDPLWAGLFAWPFRTLDAFQTYITNSSTSRDPLFFALIPPSDASLPTAEQHVLGHMSFLRIDSANRVIEIGHILLSPALQRTRAATEMQYLAMAYAFGQLRSRRYEWKCHGENWPSRKAALRLGFTQEGIFRQHMIVKGRTRDTAWFSVMDGEWPRVRDALEKWLDDGNFDEGGRQKARLEELRG